jgi:undecaprenyl diphosphate synthase
MRVPAHVAIIMDGNGRWARQRGLPTLAGHQAGTENIRRIIRCFVEHGVHYLTLYAFSTENWSRPASEVQGLFGILRDVIGREVDELHREGVQLRHIGSLAGVPSDLRQSIQDAIALTRENDRLVLALAFNYGGRAEIAEAVRRIVQDGITPEAIDECLVGRYLYTAGLPDPDLIIRTAGEMRLSNFLIWQAAYAEYYSTPALWPDFDQQEIRAAMDEYGRRRRRFGGRDEA